MDRVEMEERSCDSSDSSETRNGSAEQGAAGDGEETAARERQRWRIGRQGQFQSGLGSALWWVSASRREWSVTGRRVGSDWEPDPQRASALSVKRPQRSHGRVSGAGRPLSFRCATVVCRCPSRCATS